jgi:DUF3078 family protein
MNKKYFVIAFLILFASSTIAVLAQDTAKVKPDTSMMPVKDTSWHRGGFASVTFNQVSLSNWAAGGQSSLSLATVLNLWDNYKKDKVSWDNSLNLGYGMLQQDGGMPIKNQDNIELNSKYGRLIKGKFNLSALLNFRSQFAPGYNYPNDSQVISRFAAPAYVTVAIGVDYNPTSWLSLFLSPATGRLIIVTDQALADSGAYGVDPAIFDANHNLITHGETTKKQFGAYFRAKFAKDFWKSVFLSSDLALFDNYTDPVPAYRKDIVVNWDNALNIKTGKFLTTSIMTNMIYDHSVDLPTYQTINGVQTVIGKGPKLQFKEVFGIGLSYKFTNRK